MIRRRDEHQNMRLDRITVRNFKAVRDSGAIKLGGLNVFIGNNGSGKSSMIEALELFHRAYRLSLDTALQHWFGYDGVWNKAEAPKILATERDVIRHARPISLQIAGKLGASRFRMESRVGGQPEPFFDYETFELHGQTIQGYTDDEGDHVHEGHAVWTIKRDHAGETNDSKVFRDGFSVCGGLPARPPFSSAIPWELRSPQDRWQFLSLDQGAMLRPAVVTRYVPYDLLERDGSNLGSYLRAIYDRNREAFEGIIEAMRFVVPYAKDLKPVVEPGIQRLIHVQLGEADFRVPGWALSSGTVRMLALLAVLRNPARPQLIVIEEIENGLDPRSLGLLVEEIRRVVETTPTQVIVTTHSPYFLDLVEHEHVVLVERDETGEPKFVRPDSIKALAKWRKEYSPGRLYTNVLLNRKNT